MELTIEQVLQQGIAAHKKGELQEAGRLYRVVLQTQPAHPDANHNLGLISISVNQSAAALPLFKIALEANPKIEQFWLSYIDALIKEKHFKDAKRELKKGKKSGLSKNKLNTLTQQLTSAIKDPVPPQTEVNNLLEFYQKAQFDDAEKLAVSITQQFPDHPFSWNILGAVLKQTGRLEEAEASYKEAIALKPDYAEAYWNLSLTLNQEGNLAKGFELYEWRFKKKGIMDKAPRVAFCWDGKQSLKGKRFVIYDEQGLGDIIQFSRYLPLMVQKGAIVSFKVKRSLHKLFGTLSENITLITELPNDDELDFEAPLMSLPHLFETTLATVPASTPYLYADEAKIKTWAAKLVKDKFRIGICWQGSKGKVDFGRSFPLSLYKDISEIPDVELISLHKGEGEDQHSGITFDVTTFGKELDDGPYAFLDTAAVMMNCDLIITSDTAVAHLAGALGRQTWVALKHIPDWRWMLQTPKTPWYPTLTLYRQKTQGDWATVFATIEQDLCSLLNQKGY